MNENDESDDHEADRLRPLTPDSPGAVAEARLRRRLAHRHSDADRPQLQLRLGIALLAQQRILEAQTVLREVVRIDGASTALAALLLLIRVSDDAGLDELITAAEARARPAEHAGAVVDLAICLIERDRGVEARRLLQRVLDEAPGPAPRGQEDAAIRRARAVAAYRLAVLELAEGDSERVHDLFLEAVAANDPGATPLAALQLSELLLAVDPYAYLADYLLLLAWNFDHPTASPQAGQRLFGLFAKRHQLDRAHGLLEEMVGRGDPDLVAWANEQSAALEQPPLAPPAAKTAGSDPRAKAAQVVHGARSLVARAARHEKHQPRPTLIIGAGSGARRLLREIDTRRVNVVGLLDDRISGELHTHRVLGPISDLDRVLAEEHIERVILCIPTASPQLRYNVAEVCAKHEVGLRVLPNMYELLSDRDYPRQLRPMRIEETYGSDEPVMPDRSVDVAARNLSVMIIGVGTLGSELARQVVRARPSHLTLIDQGEAPLVRLSEELNLERRFQWTFPVLADATNQMQMRRVMRTHAPDLVFLTAGLNHAHLATDNIHHSEFANVYAAFTAAYEAARAGASRIVLASSDNAAHNRTMFDSVKRLTEYAVTSIESQSTVICAVRLRNVMRTTGSVVERFERQYKYGGPLTVTDAHASRRSLSVHEAAEWLLRVSLIAEPGAIYAVDRGTPIRPLELAERLIRLRGLQQNRDIRINVTGARQGEKRSDQLWGSDEQFVETQLRDVVRILNTNPDPDLRERVAQLMEALPRLVTADGEHEDDDSADLAELVPSIPEW